MKIVVLDGFALNPGDLSWKEIRNLGELVVYDRTEPRLIVNRISSSDVVLVNKVPITRETIDACPTVKMIGVMATGYNTIDVKYAREKGIVVCNVPAYSTSSVTQHVFAMLFALTTHIAEQSQSVKAGEWQRSKDFAYWNEPLTEISGKTIGIIGMGQIGRSVAKAAKAFGMKVLAFSKTVRPELEDEALQYVTLEHLLSCSDIVSLHCPLTPETTNLIRKETIAQMKDGAILINTSRGQTVQEQDLADALTSGKLRGAAVDVLCQEPPKDGSPLIDNPRCIVTPHTAWAPYEARKRCMEIVVENLKAFAQGHPQNIVEAEEIKQE